ncbi:hypothetical protein PIB30_081984 [Stylosanthes scabra]|uniref:Uncharacterized protein n=1 Tax=Stylosanthes scabra TaxID=79078 RepID=A0ABU6ZQJ9_9FABA|nr:hypothetical protein [Stylosanthes scabra]
MVSFRRARKKWVGFDSSAGQYEPEKLASLYAECTFFRIKLYVVFPQLTKDFQEVFFMSSALWCFCYHVVNIDFHVAADLLSKDLVHKHLIGGTCIFKSKGHNLITKVLSTNLSMQGRGYASFGQALFRSDCWVDSQFVAYDVGVNAWHISWTPCKEVGVILEQLDEVSFVLGF